MCSLMLKSPDLNTVSHMHYVVTVHLKQLLALNIRISHFPLGCVCVHVDVRENQRVGKKWNVLGITPNL